MDWPAFLPKGGLESNYEQHFRRFVFPNGTRTILRNLRFTIVSREIDYHDRGGILNRYFDSKRKNIWNGLMPPLRGKSRGGKKRRLCPPLSRMEKLYEARPFDLGSLEKRASQRTVIYLQNCWKQRNRPVFIIRSTSFRFAYSLLRHLNLARGIGFTALLTTGRLLRVHLAATGLTDGVPDVIDASPAPFLPFPVWNTRSIENRAAYFRLDTKGLWLRKEKSLEIFGEISRAKITREKREKSEMEQLRRRSDVIRENRAERRATKRRIF